jgi:hypothetical protein
MSIELPEAASDQEQPTMPGTKALSPPLTDEPTQAMASSKVKSLHGECAARADVELKGPAIQVTAQSGKSWKPAAAE